MPANQRVLQIGVEGPGEVITDNTEEIQTALLDVNRNAQSGGCHAQGRLSGLHEMAGLMLAVLAGRRLLRRRRLASA